MKQKMIKVKIYTKTGDAGSTGLLGGKRVPKSDPRITAYGTVDEISAILGHAALQAPSHITTLLHSIQRDMFVLGADLSNPDANDTRVRITPKMTIRLEHIIDGMDGSLPPLTNFILPGGSHTGSLLHLARAVARRAETHIVSLSHDEYVNPECTKYVNRLSDLLFVMSREANRAAGLTDHIWQFEPDDHA